MVKIKNIFGVGHFFFKWEKKLTKEYVYINIEYTIIYMLDKQINGYIFNNKYNFSYKLAIQHNEENKI